MDATTQFLSMILLCDKVFSAFKQTPPAQLPGGWARCGRPIAPGALHTGGKFYIQ